MKAIDTKAAGKRIKEIRLGLSSKKTTLEQFGKMLNPPADKGVVGRWEKGVNLPNNERLFQIAEIGNVTTDYILFGKQLNGYGERIENLRDKKKYSREELSRMLNPMKTEEDISAIENEVYFPKYEELKQIARILSSTIYFIAFGIKRRQSFHSDTDFDVFEKLDTTEKLLQASELKNDELVDSDMFFYQMNDIRLKQIDNPDYYNSVAKLITLINPENIDEVLKNLEK